MQNYDVFSLYSLVFFMYMKYTKIYDFFPMEIMDIYLTSIYSHFVCKFYFSHIPSAIYFPSFCIQMLSKEAIKTANANKRSRKCSLYTSAIGKH